jgi:hypothetical protein
MVKEFRVQDIYMFTCINKYNIECIVSYVDPQGNHQLMFTVDARNLPHMREIAKQLTPNVGEITLTHYSKRQVIESYK